MSVSLQTHNYWKFCSDLPNPQWCHNSSERRTYSFATFISRLFWFAKIMNLFSQNFEETLQTPFKTLLLTLLRQKLILNINLNSTPYTTPTSFSLAFSQQFHHFNTFPIFPQPIFSQPQDKLSVHPFPYQRKQGNECKQFSPAHVTHLAAKFS